MNRPVPMSQQDLIATLTDILDRVKVGDSLEGNIEWLLPDRTDPEGAYAMVRGAYRTGNRDHGQGFMQFIGELGSQPEPPVAPRGCDECSSEPGEVHGGGCPAVAGGA